MKTYMLHFPPMLQYLNTNTIILTEFVILHPLKQRHPSILHSKQYEIIIPTIENFIITSIHITVSSNETSHLQSVNVNQIMLKIDSSTNDSSPCQLGTLEGFIACFASL